MRKKKKARFITNPAVVAELRSLYKQNDGILLPQVVVDHARNPKSALHDTFEWNDSKAAEAYRIEQARGLLQVVVEIMDTPSGKIPCRVFMSLTPDRVDGGYRASVDIYNDSDMRQRLLLDALDELERIKVKYAHLKELAGVFAAIQRVRRPRR